MSYSLQTDLYQINMAYAYYMDNVHTKKAVFELYFRKKPFGSGYVVFAGLERVIEVINNFKFSNLDIEYLRKYGYNESFLMYLKDLSFSGSLKSVKEGEIIFAKEPIIIVEAPLIEAQLLETLLLNVVGFQTLVATKASRIKRLIKDASAIEFGARRAQETSAALWGARSSYIVGFDGTSLLNAGKMFDIPVFGTHAHSFIQVYQDEYIAFMKYAKVHKDVVFLIDTYDSIKSGIINAIKVANELKDNINFVGVRIDSGDLAYTSKRVRKILDEAGYTSTKIFVSNDLDENTIASLLLEGAKIDVYGIGTKLITAYDQPSLGTVYKLVQIDNKDVIKISNNIEKITTPGSKKVLRVINKTNKSEGDLVALKNEVFEKNMPIKLQAESNPLLFKEITNYTLLNIHHSIFENGNLVYDIPTLDEIRSYHKIAIERIWDEVLRFKNPAKYYVDLSQKCLDNKLSLIKVHIE
ncbi:MAG: nicotinate phosphoribosyltransferase [Bacilli bacterium]